MPIEHINMTDTLNEGREKLNNAITAFNETVVEGDSSVEAAQARVDEKVVHPPILRERIDDGMNSVNHQLAHKADKTCVEEALSIKAKQVDLNTEKGHIDNLIANAGDTDGNAELIDIRVGWDGIIYPTAGDAVRSIQKFMT